MRERTRALAGAVVRKAKREVMRVYTGVCVPFILHPEGFFSFLEVGVLLIVHGKRRDGARGGGE